MEATLDHKTGAPSERDRRAVRGQRHPDNLLVFRLQFE
jgi:hypothetical protein